MRPSDAELLRRTALHRAVGAEVMDRLVRGAFVQAMPKGATLFAQGDEPEFLHILLSGRVSLCADSPAGASTIVEIFPAGEVFVAPAAILDLPYLVTARVTVDARVLMIPAEAFRRLLAEEVALACALTEVLARHWRLLVEQIKDLKLRPAGERLASLLVGLAATRTGPATVRLVEDRKLLAARLGMTPESMSRALLALRRHGVQPHGKEIRIERVEALRALCGLDAPPGGTP